jgi:hypothetical protein
MNKTSVNASFGLKTMETIDPFGNRIRFSENLKSATDEHG